MCLATLREAEQRVKQKGHGFGISGFITEDWNRHGPDMSLAFGCRISQWAHSEVPFDVYQILPEGTSVREIPFFYQRNNVMSREYPLFQKGNVFLERIWYFKRIRFVLKE